MPYGGDTLALVHDVAVANSSEADRQTSCKEAPEQRLLENHERKFDHAHDL